MNKQQLIKSIRKERRLATELRKTANTVYSNNYGSLESKGIQQVAQQRINRLNISSKQKITKLTNKQLKHVLNNYKLQTGSGRLITVKRTSASGLATTSTRVINTKLSKEMLKKKFLRGILDEGFNEVDVDKEKMERYINGLMDTEEREEFMGELQDAREARVVKNEIRKKSDVVLQGEKNLLTTLNKRGKVNVLEMDLNKSHNKHLYNVNNNHDKQVFNKVEKLAAQGRVFIDPNTDMDFLKTQHNNSTLKQQMFLENELLAVKKGINKALTKKRTAIAKTQLRNSRKFINKFLKIVGKIFR